MAKVLRLLAWGAVAAAGAIAVLVAALHRGESINALWLVTAGLCTFAISYRFYSKWLTVKVLVLDERRAPAVHHPARRQGLRAHEQVGRLRPPLRGDCRAWAAGRPGARGAVRLPAGHALDPHRRHAGRRRARRGDPLRVDAPLRQVARPDAQGGGQSRRRLRRHDQPAGHHDDPARRARAGRRQGPRREPVGAVHDRDDHPAGDDDGRRAHARAGQRAGPSPCSAWRACSPACGPAATSRRGA